MKIQKSQQLLQQAYAYYQNKDFDTALNFCKKAKSLTPKFYPVHNTLGLISLAKGELSKASQAFQTALKLDKSDIIVWMNYGSVLEKLGKLPQAEKAYRQALELNPNDYIALNNLSNVLIYLNKASDVADLLDRAIKINDKEALAYHTYGFYFDHLGNQEKAIRYYQKALDRNPKSHISLLNKAESHLLLDQYDDAISCFSKILEHDPDNAKALARLGHINIQTGDLVKANELLRKSLSIQEDSFSYSDLVLTNQIKKDDPVIEKIENAFQKTKDKQEKTRLGFALAYLCDRLEQYKKSFEFLKKANQYKRNEIKFNIKKEVEKLTAYQSFRKLDLKVEQTGSTQHIFILGMPRSGSTLVEQIISSCPDVFGAGEINSFEKSIHQVVPTYPDQSNTYNSDMINQIAQLYDNEIVKISDNNQYVTNKHLSNFKHIGLIKSCFPSAKIIHCTRDPMDICFSIYMQNFNSNIPYAYDLEEIAKYYQTYQSVMKHWEQQFGDEIHTINYEKLIENQEEETRKLLDFCKIDFHENSLDFHKNKRVVKTASFGQVREPIYKKSVQRWLNYEDELQPLKEYLGLA